MTKKTKIHLPVSFNGNGIARKNVKIETDLPVLFLAGPIRNAPKWQEEAIKILIKKDEEIFVASPTRDLSDDLLSCLEVDNENYETFERQRAWERYYLNQASSRGCIVFWLPKEAEVKEVPDKVYAHITMMELGEWIARCTADKEMNLVIGTDGNFPEWSTIENEIKEELGMFHICTSLEETIESALRHIRLSEKIDRASVS